MNTSFSEKKNSIFQEKKKKKKYSLIISCKTQGKDLNCIHAHICRGGLEKNVQKQCFSVGSTISQFFLLLIFI